ncbi:MAG: hypothetical protein QNJ97_06935 [Myxococcota bacterium]|nr:hypothetical protein [Myxococcota bacterium]
MILHNGPMRFDRVHSGHFISFFVVAIAAAGVSIARGVSDVDGVHGETDQLEQQLSGKLNLVVQPTGVHETANKPETGLTAALKWREIVFLAAKEKQLPADLYRAEVRTVEDQGIISIRGVRNLTDTPAGDEYALVNCPPQVAVLTRALGQVRSATVFDIRGQVLSSDDGWTLLTRLTARLTDFLRTGHFQGIRKTALRFSPPPSWADLSVEGAGTPDMRIGVNWTDLEETFFAVDIRSDQDPVETEGLIPTADVRLPKHLILWLVDTVRSISWIGPGPIEWAEGRYFAIRDALRRFTYALFGEDDAVGEEDAADADELRRAVAVSMGLEVGSLETPWPPPNIPAPVFKRLARGEGRWRPAVPGFVPALSGAPPIVYRTYTRPDIQRPYVRVHLMAMDMRQLDLHMVGGYEDPQPTTGSQGTGRIPRKRAILSRTVLAFNGAFKTLHGAYGMMVEKDVLLPPQDRAATVATMDDGQVLMGSWPTGLKIPANMVSLRQNMDPLVENSVVNPRRRYLWGFTLDEDIRNMNTIRSGICMTAAGSMIYAWGEDLTATTLGIAMNAAGCTYGIHLDMNPFHTSFIYYHFKDPVDGKRPDFDAELILPEMRFSPYRYVNGAPKDFFFLTLKDTSPPGPDWQSEGLAQPAPAFVPAVHKLQVGGAAFLAIDMTRAVAEIEPGEVPHHLAPAGGVKIPSRDHPDLVLVDVLLGRWSLTRGQLTAGAIVAQLTPDRATLAIDPHSKPHIGMWPLRVGKNKHIGHAVQGDWLSAGGNTRGVAVGRLKNRWLVLGEGAKQDLVQALKDLNVARPIFFRAETPGAAITVRTPKGMVDLTGNPITTRDAESAALRILAHPRPMGMAGLAASLSEGGSP